MTVAEELQRPGFKGGVSGRESGSPARSGLPKPGCKGSVSGRALTDSSLAIGPGTEEVPALSASSCAGAGAAALLSPSIGPGGLAERISKTEAAICLLAKLMRSPKLGFEARLCRPSDASVSGSELRGKELSGCHSMAGVSLSCQEGKPCSLLSSAVVLGSDVGGKLVGAAANMEGGMFTCAIVFEAAKDSQQHPPAGT
jgi:hypothetical protein